MAIPLEQQKTTVDIDGKKVTAYLLKVSDEVTGKKDGHGLEFEWPTPYPADDSLTGLQVCDMCKNWTYGEDNKEYCLLPPGIELKTPHNAPCFQYQHNIDDKWAQAKKTQEQARKEQIEAETKRELNQQPKNIEKWKLLGFDEIMQDRLPQVWDLQGIIPKCCNVLLQGAGGIGKTYFALYLLVCLAIGRPILQDNNGVNGITTRKCKVLFISGEMGEDSIARRLKAVLAGLNLNAEEVQSFKENFKFVALPEPALRLSDDNSINTLMEAVKEHKAEVCVIDHLNATKGAAKENSDEMGAIIQALRENINKSCNCSPWVIHHERKPSKDSNGDSTSEARGHSSIKDNSDLVLQLSRKDGLTRYAITKTKYGIEREFYGLTEIDNDENDEPMAVRFVGGVSPVSAETLERQDSIIAYIHNSKPLKRTELYDKLEDILDLSDKPIRELIANMIKNNELELDKDNFVVLSCKTKARLAYKD